tara:strand:+ start:150 stop:548 length:399 start_codon:yes stop_codon:yes gene_type:complete
MKSFNDNEETKNKNPFYNITDEQFDNMLNEGFEKATLDCYAHLKGSICYKKSFESSIGWYVNCYITEQGMAVDHDYDCGGNSCNKTWWFEDGEYTLKDFNYSTYEYDDVTYTKFANNFVTAWDKMITYSKSL